MVQKNLINIWNVNVDNIVVSNLTETKNNSKYLIGYLDEVIRPLILIFPKMSGYVKIEQSQPGCLGNFCENVLRWRPLTFL